MVETTAGDATPFLDIGWILLGDGDPAQRRAVAEAAERMRATLQELFPRFRWRTTIAERPAEPGRGALEPVLLLDEAEIERDGRNWDYVFVVTPRDLVSHTRPFMLAAPSRIFSTAVVSLARLAGPETPQEAATERLFALALHLFGRLNGLDGDAKAGFMRRFDEARELEGRDRFEAAERRSLARTLSAVADPRVEERTGGRQGVAAFYLRSLWENRRALLPSILRMRPWAFPARLSRLTTAAGSALVVLMMTAEAWELALSLEGLGVAGLGLLSLLVTSAYLLQAQRLLARAGPRVLREQRAMSNVSTVLAVAVGMAVTFLAIFAVAWLAAALLFGDALLARWAGEGFAASLPRVQMAAFTAAICLAIGALGASFEPHGYFRAVTQIDDEL